TQIDGVRAAAAAARREAAALPRGAERSLEGARDETAAAAESLDAQDSKAGLEHAQKALDLLRQGLESAAKALEQQQRMEAALSRPGGGAMRRPSPGGPAQAGSGADLRGVRLPSASDYQPPQEIRRQVIESLQERMPSSQQPAIKDYLKKVSE